MSYISAIRKKETGSDKILVWERDGDKRKIRIFDTSDYLYFYVEDENGEYESIFGKKLTKLEFENTYTFHAAKEELHNEGFATYESDIPPEIKALSANYFEKEAPKLNISFYDIEVDYDPNIGFSSTSNPYAPINAISLYHEFSKRLVVIAVPPNNQRQWFDKKLLLDEVNKATAIPSEYNVDLLICENEMELLVEFLDEIKLSDGLVGWNNEFFDTPYVCKRIEEVLGKPFLKRMSFEGANMPKYREIEKFGKTEIGVDISGRLDIDYKELFKKYEAAGRQSYSLEAISNEVIPDMAKMEYEGSLHSLYRNNFPFFIRYNIRDVECMNEFEKKLGYVKLANEMCHISTGIYKYVTGTLKLSDLAIINYCHYKFNKIVPDFTDKPTRTIKGAYVLCPQKGMHEWIASIDINSLYPSSIRSINISPETLKGQFIEEIKASEAIARNDENIQLTFVFEDTKESDTKLASEWREYFIERKWAVSGFGTVFDQNKQGIIPTVLEDWYNQRKKYKKLSKQALEKGDKTNGAYYDRLQYVYKIKLNSLYGAITNPFFRFFDLRMGESTTGTGRIILNHQCRKVNEVLEGNYNVDFPLYEFVEDALEIGESAETALHGPKFNGSFMSKSVIMGDTDSVYFKLPTTNEEEAIELADAIADYVNNSYKEFMSETFLCIEGFNNLIVAGREIVSDRSIFGKKKHYILHITNNEGQKVDKLKIMGFDLKKTTLPAPIKKRLTMYIRRLLLGEDWDNVIAPEVVEYKKTLSQPENILDIGLPKGVKKVEHYTAEFNADKDTNLPGHVAASILWNKCLEMYNDKESLKITSNMKIKVLYLKTKIERFKSIAVPVDIEIIPKWFIDNFIPIVDVDAQIERLVDNPLENIIENIGKLSPSEQSLFVDSILVF